MATADNVDGLSRVKGLRLEEEPGIGALTIPGYLNELVSRFAKREAVIMNTPGQRITWTYEDLQTPRDGSRQSIDCQRCWETWPRWDPHDQSSRISWPPCLVPRWSAGLRWPFQPSRPAKNSTT